MIVTYRGSTTCDARLLLISNSQVVRQGRLQETNRAVHILLIVGNVLIETRKSLFHMASNQSHAPRV